MKMLAHLPSFCKFFLGREELVDEILLSLAGYFRCLGGDIASVSVDVGGFFDFKKPQFHTSLRGHIPIGALALDEIAVTAEPFKQSSLPHIDIVLLEEFRHFTYEDRGVRSGYGIGKEDFWFLFLDLPVEFFGVIQHSADELAGGIVGTGEIVVDECIGVVDIAAGFADGGQDVVGDPALERFGFGFA